MTQLTKTNRIITIFIVIAAIIASAFIFLATRPVDSYFDYSQYSSKTVSLDNTGTQIITMKANTGYSPNKILAKSNFPTKLRVQTENTFDCTSVMSIPSLRILKSLPSSGTTDIDIPSQIAGSVITGYCGASTYQFVIRFS